MIKDPPMHFSSATEPSSKQHRRHIHRHKHDSHHGRHGKPLVGRADVDTESMETSPSRHKHYSHRSRFGDRLEARGDIHTESSEISWTLSTLDSQPTYISIVRVRRVEVGPHTGDLPPSQPRRPPHESLTIHSRTSAVAEPNMTTLPPVTDPFLPQISCNTLASIYAVIILATSLSIILSTVSPRTHLASALAVTFLILLAHLFVSYFGSLTAILDSVPPGSLFRNPLTFSVVDWSMCIARVADTFIRIRLLGRLYGHYRQAQWLFAFRRPARDKRLADEVIRRAGIRISFANIALYLGMMLTGVLIPWTVNRHNWKVMLACQVLDCMVMTGAHLLLGLASEPWVKHKLIPKKDVPRTPVQSIFPRSPTSSRFPDFFRDSHTPRAHID